jgi:hypothetical protein
MESWEQEVRNHEEAGRVAFLAADIDVLDRLWADELIVNSPLNIVHDKGRVLELLRTGRIRHGSYETEIEYVTRHGDVVVVMGHDTVLGPPEGVVLRRRYTNLWQRYDGAWRMFARHAHVVSRSDAAGG